MRAGVKTLWITVAQRGMILKCLLLPEAEAKRMSQKVIHSHKNIKQDKTEEPEEEKSTGVLILSQRGLIALSHSDQAAGTRSGERLSAACSHTLRRSRVSPRTPPSPPHYSGPEWHQVQKAEAKSCKKRESGECIC